jgi:hypothetical protein
MATVPILKSRWKKTERELFCYIAGLSKNRSSADQTGPVLVKTTKTGWFLFLSMKDVNYHMIISSMAISEKCKSDGAFFYCG